MQKLYLFDFDGTLSSNDSSKLFYQKISNPIQYFFCYYIIPFKSIIRYFFFRGDNFEIKKKRFNGFLRFCSCKKINSFLEYSDVYIDSILKDNALKLIREIKKNPINDVYIVSASLSLILEKWTAREGIGLISNTIISTQKLNKNSYSFSTKFDCDGIGKILRIKKEILLSRYDQIIALGDTPNDFYMFDIADKYYYKTIDIIDEI